MGHLHPTALVQCDTKAGTNQAINGRREGGLVLQCVIDSMLLIAVAEERHCLPGGGGGRVVGKFKIVFGLF